MLSVSLMDRLENQRDHDRMLTELARNGLLMPLPLRVRLSQSHVAAPALALRRLVELTHGPTSLSRRMLANLLESQHSGGGFVDASEALCPLATAAATAALLRLASDHPQTRAEVLPAVEAALYALAGLQGGDGLFTASADRTVEDRWLTSAFVLYLLASHADFARTVQVGRLLDAFSDAEHVPGATGDLLRMARLMLDTIDQHAGVIEIAEVPQLLAA